MQRGSWPVPVPGRSLSHAHVEHARRLLTAEERSMIAKNEVPSWDYINTKLARSPEELELFTKIDAEEDWVAARSLEESPDWIRYTAEDIARAAPARKKRRRGALDEVLGWGGHEVRHRRCRLRCRRAARKRG
jgi:hypothetical protein